MEGHRISVIESLEEWAGLRTQWNQLLEQSASKSLFLTWEWLYSWAECFLSDERNLFIPVVYEGNEIIAAAPWYVERVKKLVMVREIDFIGTPDAGSDYLDVVIRKGKEKDVARALFDFLFSDGVSRWDRIRFNEVPSTSLFLLHFLTKIEESGKYVAIQRSSYCPVAHLPSAEEDYFLSLSAKRGRRFRQDLRTLDKQGKIEHSTFQGSEIGTALNDFFVLYTEKAGWQGDHLRRLIGKAVERGISIQIDFLSANGTYVGGLLHLRYGNILYMYLMAIDKGYSSKVSIGNVLVGLCVIKAIASGFSYYDFLKGAEDYKFHWANCGNSSSSISLSRRALTPIALTLGDLAKSAGKLLFR
jgi:CelD/BcsL family acetyltransferase involved in cellulose biosynthesis